MERVTALKAAAAARLAASVDGAFVVSVFSASVGGGASSELFQRGHMERNLEQWRVKRKFTNSSGQTYRSRSNTCT